MLPLSQTVKTTLLIREYSHRGRTHGPVLIYTPLVHAVILLANLYHILNLEKAVELIQHRFLGPNDELQAIVDDFQVSISYEYLWARGKNWKDGVGPLRLRQSPGFYPS